MSEPRVRIAYVEGRGHIVSIQTDAKQLNLYVSPKGRSVRVYEGGIEWKPITWRRGKRMRAP